MTDAIQKTEVQTIEASANITPMELIARLTMNGTNVDIIDKLMQLKREHEKDEAVKAYSKAFSDFKREQFEILKDATVDFTYSGKRTFYHHTSLAHVVNTVVPLLAKYGLSHSWETKQNENSCAVTCKVSHRDGHSESITLHAPYDTGAGKNSIQAIGSTLTYLQRYTLMSILGLASTNSDDDGAASERNPDDYINANQIAELECLITEVVGKRNLEKFTAGFLEFAGAGRMEDILKAKYNMCVKKLESLRIKP